MEKPFPDHIYIKPIKKTTIPTRFVFVDTETRQVKAGGSVIRHVLKLGHAIYWQRAKADRKEKVENYTFESEHQFWEWAVGKCGGKETLYIFAHNLTFDFLVLDGFRRLPALGFILQSIYHKFTTTVLRFALNTRRIILADTMNYFPVSLDVLAKSVNRVKIALDFDQATEAQLAERCAEDVRIVYDVVRKLVETLVNKDLGSFRTTASAMASSIYRHKHMKHAIITNHNKEVVEFEKSAYTGGVVKVGQLVSGGKPSLYKLDVNSMYPSVMLDNYFPTKLIEYGSHVNLKMLERFCNSYAVIARVVLRTSEAVYPYRLNDNVAYPVGEFVTTLTTPMLKYALAHDHIYAVEHIAVYNQEKIFKDYITEITKARADAKGADNLADELFYKTLNNSLYGKFGQKRNETKVVGSADPNTFATFAALDPETGEGWRELHAGGAIMFIYERGEARYTSFAIAAHVTDYARLKLFGMIKKAGKGQVFYSDTDSLIVDDYGLHNLRGVLGEKELGKLKIEAAAEALVVLAKKDYHFAGVHKSKGLSATRTLEEENLFTVWNNASFYGAARRNIDAGAFWYKVRKRYAPFIRDNHIERDGTITPLRLPEETELLGVRQHTLLKSKELIKYILSDVQRRGLDNWLLYD